MPVGTHTERCVSQKILQWMGITPGRVVRANLFNTVVEVATEVPIVVVAQQLHLIREWEEILVNVSCMMGKKEYIMDVVRHSSEVIKQRGETEGDSMCLHRSTRTEGDFDSLGGSCEPTSVADWQFASTISSRVHSQDP